jgi:RNA polymerase sigma factor FliA
MYTQIGTFDRETAVTNYAPLVKRLAHHLAAKLPPSVQVDDIIQAGMMGLMDAANRYEKEHGTQFETYATQRIRGAMLDELRQNDWMPRTVRGSQRRIEATMSRLEQRLGRVATDSEMAAELQMTITQYHELLNEARGCQLLHLDELGGNDSEEQYLDRHRTDDDDDPLKQIEDQRFRSALVNAIEHLPEREKMVMGLYYEQDLNFREIAAVIGVTESRVCQIHTQAVARLRTKLTGWIRNQ